MEPANNQSSPENETIDKVVLNETAVSSAQTILAAEPVASSGTVKPKSNKKLIVIIIAIVALIALSPIITGVIFATVIIGDCSRREKNMDKAAVDLRQELDSLKISSYTVESITADKDGNCMTGTGAQGSIGLKTDGGTIIDGYNKLLTEAFNIQNANQKELVINYTAGNTEILGMKTELTYNSHEYNIYFDLAEPKRCMPNIQLSACDFGKDPITSSDLYNQKVDKITIYSHIYTK